MTVALLTDEDDFVKTFWARVEKGRDCWKWNGPKDTRGYGRHQHFLAHRVSYEIANGPIPLGRVINHLCRNPWCVNPEHMEPVTSKVNTDRGKPREEYDAHSAVKMACPDCGEPLDKVIDSRPNEAGIRRRRVCANGHRATTYEYVAARAA